jgi:perosamine synthetase
METMPLTRPSFDERELALLRECLASGWVTQGPLTERFERTVAERHGVRHARATTSCTAALHLATSALGLGPDDEVIVPAFTWITSANCAEYVGARAVLVDVDPTTFNLDPARIARAVTSRTRAVVAVHLFGLAADIGAIRAAVGRPDIRIIEDAACAIGTTLRGTPVGGLGDLGCFSFHPRKVVTTGEGGMVTTNDASLDEVVASLRNHGAGGLPPAEVESRGPWSMAIFERLGYNLRLSDIQAAVGVAQMEKLDRLLAERRRLAAYYTDRLAGVADLALPVAGDNAGHSYQSYVVRLLDGGRPRRNQIMRVLEAAGIQTRPGTHAVHLLGYYRRKYGYAREDFPHAATCEDTTITLPIFPGMQPAHTTHVVETLRGAVASGTSTS